jgi:hypothetical protein
MRFDRLFVLLTFVFLSVPPGARAAAVAAEFRTSDVFFEMFFDDYVDHANLDLFRNGLVKLEPIGTESIQGFDWVNHTRQDRSWWHRIENFEYLLPVLASEGDGDRTLASKWLSNWYQVHENPRAPNPGAWDGMTAGIRAMIFVWYLKLEESRTPRDHYTISLLRNSIARHQWFLAKEENFETNSNHGMWEAMGLFETTRVVPRPELTGLALRRLLQLTRDSVSDKGVHMEHSPGYHFYFLEWLSQYVEYLASLPALTWNEFDELATIEKTMRGASWYLFDHRTNVPQIGDTDSRRLGEEALQRWPPAQTATLFDNESGYAIYKDLPSSQSERYIVYCIQNMEFDTALPHHWHNDMLSVYYSDGGEIILGDSGRHSYSRTKTRSFLMSLAAHNTVFLASMIVPKAPGIFLADRVWNEDAKGRAVFGAALRDDAVMRQVVVDDGGPSLRVEDEITLDESVLSLWHIGADVVRVNAVESPKNPSARKRRYTWILVTKSGDTFDLTLDIEGESLSPPGSEVTLVEGQRNPFMGWYSPSYNVFKPAPVIKITIHPKDRIRIVTVVDKRN